VGRIARVIRSRWRKALIALLIAIVGFAAVTARVLVWPPQGAPALVSAIVLFAGPGNRMPVALQLAKEHRAPVLVISQGWMGYGGPCPLPASGVQTICFEPNPGDTRGEAEHVGALAKQHGWSSLILVVTRTQAERARLLVGRCFGGPTYVVTAPIATTQWPYQLAYGWGALVKALFTHTSC
jgi:uncharacterized SAM-binding protein YcdF (DUF218 family)